METFFSQLSFDNEPVSVLASDGFLIDVFPNDMIGRHIYLSGKFERSVVEVLLGFAKPSDVLLDIGANIGYVSACFLHNVLGSKVIAVEPQPKLVNLLSLNLGRFGANRHRVFQVAIADRDHTGFLQVCDTNFGASQVVQQKNSHTVEIQLWSSRRLFQAIDERVDLIKIDIEGHERMILEACVSDIARLRPRAILFEDQTRSAAPNGPIGSIFKDIGYRVQGIKKRMTKVELVPISNVSDCSHNDYVAVPI
jgi:FkbM family methyltransferase